MFHPCHTNLPGGMFGALHICSLGQQSSIPLGPHLCLGSFCLSWLERKVPSDPLIWAVLGFCYFYVLRSSGLLCGGPMVMLEPAGWLCRAALSMAVHLGEPETGHSSTV